MKKQLIYTKRDSDEIISFPDKELEKFITTNYDFEIGYTPEGYDAVFLLIKEDKEDSRNDVWKIVLFNKSSQFGAKTITLDNIDNVDGLKEDAAVESKFEVLKEIEGNFEETIDSAVGLIKKLKKI